MEECMIEHKVRWKLSPDDDPGERRAGKIWAVSIKGIKWFWITVFYMAHER